MLGKLIKHEFRATGRILLPVYLVMLLTAALVRGFQVLTEQTAGEFMRVLAVLSVLLFSAAVFGGIGSIPGAMVGGILLGIIEIFAKAYISTQLSDAIVFAVLIIVLIVKPAGLLGKQIREKV